MDQEVVGGEVVHGRCLSMRVPVARGGGPQRFVKIPRRCAVVVAKTGKADALLRRDASRSQACHELWDDPTGLTNPVQ